MHSTPMTKQIPAVHYTKGEEIANSITHGVGIIQTVVMIASTRLSVACIARSIRSFGVIRLSAPGCRQNNCG